MADKLLDEHKQAWIEARVSEWGARVYSGLDFECRTNMIARLMLSVDPNQVKEPVREQCNDDLGMVISSVVGYCIKKPCPQDYKYLEAKYVYGRSVYAIAKYQHAKDPSIKFATWKLRVRESIKASEWVVAKFLDLAIKNHKNAIKLRKFAYS